MKKVFLLAAIIFLGSSIFNLFAQSNYYKIANQKIQKYNPKRKDLVIIIDYTKNIFSQRLFLLDMQNKKIILSCKVSHAWNSGFLYPTSYSNFHGTNKSSKGTFITKGTKWGNFGYSMIIEGLDKGVNNYAKNRLIIFHSDKKMKTKWSKGCFATSEENNKKIIDMSKNGVLVCVID